MARTISISMPSLAGIACLTPALAEKVRVVFVTLATPSTTMQCVFYTVHTPSILGNC